VLRDRFSRPLDPRAVDLSQSTDEDATLLPYDLWGSLAHAKMLGETGILPARSARRILGGLRSIAREVERGRFALRPDLEDVHLNVEAALTERIGDDGQRLHTARSRNDQVALDIALYLRDALLDLEAAGTELGRALLERARSPMGRRIVPGWTHLQPAQRLFWGQILGTHALRLARDVERLRSIRERLTDCPLGSGAIAGTSLPIDRRLTARLLGFARPGLSSLDDVSDRDAATETLFALALLEVHLSALAEELVVGSMPGVDRVRLADAFVTTSSLMPHKRNPDTAELLRAAAGPALGRLMGHLALLKSLPIGYQRDLQPGKPLLFDAVRDALTLLHVAAPMVSTTEFRSEADGPGSDTASVELVDALVRGGVPFRTAHSRVAKWVGALAEGGRHLSHATAAELTAAFPELARTGFKMPRPTEEPDRRASEGGSSWGSVGRLLREVETRLATDRRSVERERRRLTQLRTALGAPGPRRRATSRSRPRAGSP